MRPTSKISGEAREDVAVVASHVGHRKRKRKVAVGLSLEAKRDVLEQFIPEYREAQCVQKRVLLDDFTRLTGYHRTYAIWLFNHHTPDHQTSPLFSPHGYLSKPLALDEHSNSRSPSMSTLS